MTRREPPWDALRTFGEVMRDRTLSSAARKLSLSQPTVGRHIDALEAALGVALFMRSPRGLEPTQEARDLAPHVETMIAAAAALGRTASGEAGGERGVVRVTASEIVGCEVLPGILASLRAAHPGIVLELALTNRNEDLARRDADVAVRMVRPTQSALIARRIGRYRSASTRIATIWRGRERRARSPTSLAIASSASTATIMHSAPSAPRSSRSRGRISAFAATAIWRSSRRCARGWASAAARRRSPAARASSRRSCRARCATRWRSGSSCTRIRRRRAACASPSTTSRGG